MLRVLALLCSLALLLAPFGPAQAEPACAIVAAATTHSAHGADHQMPASGHPAETCKQLCAVVAILAPPQPDAARFAFVRPSPTLAARLLDQPPPGPFERPPKLLV